MEIIDVKAFGLEFIRGCKVVTKNNPTRYEQEAVYEMFHQALFNHMEPFRAGQAAIITLYQIDGGVNPRNN